MKLVRIIAGARASAGVPGGITRIGSHEHPPRYRQAGPWGARPTVTECWEVGTAGHDPLAQRVMLAHYKGGRFTTTMW
jgi:hypothetical protein